MSLARRTRHWRPLLIVAIAVLAVAAWGVVEAHGCPTCKDGIGATDPDGQNVARGYFYSILLMLAMPFTLAGSFGCYVWREMRRQQREQQDAAGVGRGMAATIEDAGHRDRTA
jgi:hypothetical protein